MAKSLTDNTKPNAKYMGKGVFVEKVKITKVEDMSNYPLKKTDVPKKAGNFQTELCLIVHYLTADNTERKMTLFGKFRYETDPVSGKQGKYLGWDKKGNGVQTFLYRILGAHALIGDDDTILQGTIMKLKDKEFFKLRYCIGEVESYPGKPSFRDWQTTESGQKENGEESLYAEFLKSAPYLKEYDEDFYDIWKAAQDKKTGSFTPSSQSHEDVTNPNNESPI